MKKIKAAILTLAMMLSLFTVNASAEGEYNTEVLVTSEPAIMSVVLPTAFCVYDNSQRIVLPEGYYIMNRSTAPIVVSSVKMIEANGWRAVEPMTDFSEVPVNSQYFWLTLNGDAAPSTGTSAAMSDFHSPANWPIMRGFDTTLDVSQLQTSTPTDITDILPSCEINVNFGASVQADAYMGSVCYIIFTVRWATESECEVFQ